MSHFDATSARRPMPYARTAGTGPTVICLHSSTSSSKQFTGLMDRLADSVRIVAVDLYGYGKSPSWPGHRSLTLYDEVSLLEPVFAAERGPLYLVGHSYGGAVAAKAATVYSTRIAGMVLYEPVLFGLLDTAHDRPARREIGGIRDDVRRLVGRGDTVAAARRFVEYWTGAGAWERLPEWQRDVIAARMPKVVHDFDAVMNEPTPLSRFGELAVPTKLMVGSESPQTTQRITGHLSSVMPDSIRCVVDGAGHMGPMTHPEQVNRAIEGFLNRQLRHTSISRPDHRSSDLVSGLYSSL